MAVKKLYPGQEAVTNKATIFKPRESNDSIDDMVKSVPKEITFRVYKDENGMLCASGINERIYTFGKTLNKLWDNIKDVIELYYDVPYTEITINLKFEAQGNGSAEAVTC